MRDVPVFAWQPDRCGEGDAWAAPRQAVFVQAGSILDPVRFSGQGLSTCASLDVNSTAVPQRVKLMRW
eukprot:7229116-Pyramimonas_sp.AAC.1